MKKYTKPGIAFESFFLSSSIVEQCDITDLHAPELEMPGLGPGGTMAYLFNTEANCSFNEDFYDNGDGVYNGICYHNPSNMVNVFGS